MGAEKAFGDSSLIKIIKMLRERLDILESTDPCPACDGKGYTEHDCMCEHCTTTEIECELCENGRVPKPIF